MNLHNITFSTMQVSKITGINDRTIANYCRYNCINHIQYLERGVYRIPADALMDFLYLRPTALKHAKRSSHGFIIDHMLQILSKKETVYSTTDVAEMFQVTKQTIWNWIKRDYLIPFSYEKRNYQNPTFRERDIKQLIHNVPRLRIFYMGCNRRRTKVS